MNKYFISLLLVFNCNLLAKYEDNNPERTTKEDLELLKDFEKLIYSTANINSQQCQQKIIFDFIFENRVVQFDYNKFTLDLKGRLNSNESLEEEDGSYSKDKASLSLIAKYPLFDKKTELDIKKKKFDFKEEILDQISKYCKTKHELVNLNQEITLLNLKQIRAKTREDVGQIYLDDRIKIIEDILTKRSKRNELDNELQTLKLKLKNYVDEYSQIKLEDLL